jgi:ubiquinone/menaquinone biosynthesis C-methylase UbiE
MAEYTFKQPDFENPSFLFRLEDHLKGFLGRFFYKSFINSFALRGTEHVLDFGCGGGVESQFVLKHLEEGGRVTCVDLSDYWIQRAKMRLRKYPNAVCIQGDIRKLDIPKKSFDVIFTIHVIHDILPEERQSTVDVLALKLKPGCPFYVWEPTKISHGMPAKEIKELFSNAGLEEQACEETKSSYRGKFVKHD